MVPIAPVRDALGILMIAVSDMLVFVIWCEGTVVADTVQALVAPDILLLPPPAHLPNATDVASLLVRQHSVLSV